MLSRKEFLIMNNQDKKIIIKEGIKEYKPNMKAIKNIYKVYRDNKNERPYEEINFTIVLLLIIEGLLPLATAESTFLDWYNGGKKWIK